jgi:SAM-dependent methyltransferase
MTIFEPIRPGAPTRFERELIGDIREVQTVLDLGNKTGPRNGPPYRNWYEDQGKTYTSIDWNGKDGALKYDLRFSITAEEIGGPFDLVCNIGTTEHVSEQRTCWENVHRFVKLGGLLVSHTPIGPGWEHHGFWHPSLEWYEEFATINGYTGCPAVAEGLWHPKYPKKMTYVRLRKIDDIGFTMPNTPIHRTPKEFDQEPQYSSIGPNTLVL